MKIRAAAGGVEFAFAGLPPIWIHFSLPLIALLLTGPFWWNKPSFTAVAVALIVGAGVIFSVLAHELGHVLVARRFGFTPVRIRMHIFGGEALLRAGGRTRSQDRWITIAGPAANLLIGLTCIAVYATLSPRLPPWDFWKMQPGYAVIAFRSLEWLGVFNIVVAFVNLLPAYLLDGGHLAHGFIQDRWGATRARFWVGLCGVISATIATLAFIGCILSGILFLGTASV